MTDAERACQAALGVALGDLGHDAATALRSPLGTRYLVTWGHVRLAMGGEVEHVAHPVPPTDAGYTWRLLQADHVGRSFVWHWAGSPIVAAVPSGDALTLSLLKRMIDTPVKKRPRAKARP